MSEVAYGAVELRSTHDEAGLGSLSSAPNVEFLIHRDHIGSHSESMLLVIGGLLEANNTMARFIQEMSEQFAFPVVGLNLHHQDSSPEGMEKMLGTVPLAVRRAANRLIGRPEDATADIGGYSIGAGAALKAMHIAPEEWEDLIMAAPVDLLGPQDNTGRELRQSIIFNWRRLKSEDYAVADEVVDEEPIDPPEIDTRGYIQRVDWTVKQPGVEMLEELTAREARARYIGVTLAGHDGIAPAPRVISALKELIINNLIDCQLVDNAGHSSFATADGRRLMRCGIERHQQHLTRMPT